MSKKADNKATNTPRKNKLKVLLGTTAGVIIGGLIVGLGTGFGLSYTNHQTATNKLPSNYTPSLTTPYSKKVELSISNNNVLVNSSVLPELNLSSSEINLNSSNVAFYWYFSSTDSNKLDLLSTSAANSRIHNTLNNTTIFLNATSTNNGYWMCAIKVSNNNTSTIYYSNVIQVNITNNITDLDLFTTNTISTSLKSINGAANLGTSANPNIFTITSNFTWKNSNIVNKLDANNSITYTLYSTNSTSYSPSLTTLNSCTKLASQVNNPVFKVTNPQASTGYFVVESINYLGQTYNNAYLSNLVWVSYNNANENMAHPSANLVPSLINNENQIAYYNSNLQANNTVSCNVYNPLGYSLSVSFQASNSALANALNSAVSSIVSINNNVITLNLPSSVFTTYNNDSFNLLIACNYSVTSNNTTSSVTYSTLTSKDVLITNITNPINTTSATNTWYKNTSTNLNLFSSLNSQLYYLNKQVNVTGITWYYNSTNTNTGGTAFSNSNEANYTLTSLPSMISSNAFYVYVVYTITYNNTTYTLTSNTSEIKVINSSSASATIPNITITANQTILITSSSSNFSTLNPNLNTDSLTFSVSGLSSINKADISINSNNSSINSTLLSELVISNDTIDLSSIDWASLLNNLSSFSFSLMLNVSVDGSTITSTSPIITIYNLSVPSIISNNQTVNLNTSSNLVFSSAFNSSTFITATYAQLISNTSKTALLTSYKNINYNNLINSTYAISNNTLSVPAFSALGTYYYFIAVVYALNIEGSTIYISGISSDTSFNTIDVISSSSAYKTLPSMDISNEDSTLLYNENYGLMSKKDLVITLTTNGWTYKDITVSVSDFTNTITSILTTTSNTLTFNWNELPSMFFSTNNKSSFYIVLNFTNGVDSYILTVPLTFNILYSTDYAANLYVDSTINYNLNNTSATITPSIVVNNTYSSLISSNTILKISNGDKDLSVSYTNGANPSITFGTLINTFGNDLGQLTFVLMDGSTILSNSVTVIFITDILPTLTFNNEKTTSNIFYTSDTSNLYFKNSTDSTFTNTFNTNLTLNASVTNSNTIRAIEYIATSTNLPTNFLTALNDLMNDSGGFPEGFNSDTSSATINSTINLATLLSTYNVNGSLQITIKFVLNNLQIVTYTTPIINIYNLALSINISNSMSATASSAFNVPYSLTNNSLPNASLVGLNSFVENSASSLTASKILASNPTFSNSTINLTQDTAGTYYLMLGIEYEIQVDNTTIYVLAFSNISTLTVNAKTPSTIIANPTITNTYTTSINYVQVGSDYVPLNNMYFTVTNGSYDYTSYTITNQSSSGTNVSAYFTYDATTHIITLTSTNLNKLIANSYNAFYLNLTFTNPSNNQTTTISSVFTLNDLGQLSTISSISSSSNSFYANTNSVILSLTPILDSSNLQALEETMGGDLISSISYQWYANNSAISGATNSSFSIDSIPSYIKDNQVTYMLTTTYVISGVSYSINSNVYTVTFYQTNTSNIFVPASKDLNYLSPFENNSAASIDLSSSQIVDMSNTASTLTITLNTINNNISFSNFSITSIKCYNTSGDPVTTTNTALSSDLSNFTYKTTNSTVSITLPSNAFKSLPTTDFYFVIQYSYDVGNTTNNGTVTTNTFNPISINTLAPTISLNSLTLYEKNVSNNSLSISSSLTNTYNATISLLGSTLLYSSSLNGLNSKLSNFNPDTTLVNGTTLSIPTGLSAGSYFVSAICKYQIVLNGSTAVIFVATKVPSTANLIILANPITNVLKPQIASSSNNSIAGYVYNADTYNTTSKTYNTAFVNNSNTITLNLTLNNWSINSNTLSSSNSTINSTLNSISSKVISVSGSVLTLDFNSLTSSEINTINHNEITLTISCINGTNTSNLTFNFYVSFSNVTTSMSNTSLTLNLTTGSDTTATITTNTPSNLTDYETFYIISTSSNTLTINDFLNNIGTSNNILSNITDGGNNSTWITGTDVTISANTILTDIQDITALANAKTLYLSACIMSKANLAILNNSSSLTSAILSSGATIFTTPVAFTANTTSSSVSNPFTISSSTTSYVYNSNNLSIYDSEANLTAGDTYTGFSTTNELSFNLNSTNSNVSIDSASITLNNISLDPTTASALTSTLNTLANSLTIPDTAYTIKLPSSISYSTEAFNFTVIFTLSTSQTITITSPTYTLYNLSASITLPSNTVIWSNADNTTATINYTNNINLPNKTLVYNEAVIESSNDTIPSLNSDWASSTSTFNAGQASLSIPSSEQTDLNNGSSSEYTPTVMIYAVYSFVINGTTYYTLLQSAATQITVLAPFMDNSLEASSDVLLNPHTDTYQKSAYTQVNFNNKYIYIDNPNKQEDPNISDIETVNWSVSLIYNSIGVVFTLSNSSDFSTYDIIVNNDTINVSGEVFSLFFVQYALSNSSVWQLTQNTNHLTKSQIITAIDNTQISTLDVKAQLSYLFNNTYTITTNEVNSTITFVTVPAFYEDISLHNTDYHLSNNNQTIVNGLDSITYMSITNGTSTSIISAIDTWNTSNAASVDGFKFYIDPTIQWYYILNSNTSAYAVPTSWLSNNNQTIQIPTSLTKSNTNIDVYAFVAETFTYNNKTYDYATFSYQLTNPILFFADGFVSVSNLSYSFNSVSYNASANKWYSTESINAVVNNKQPASDTTNTFSYVWLTSGTAYNWSMLEDNYKGYGNLSAYQFNSLSSITASQTATDPQNVTLFGTNFDINNFISSTNDNLTYSMIKTVTLTYQVSFNAMIELERGNLFDWSQQVNLPNSSTYTFTQTWSNTNASNDPSTWTTSTNWNTLNSIITAYAKSSMDTFNTDWTNKYQSEWHAWDLSTAYKTTALSIGFNTPTSNPYTLTLTLTNGTTINIPVGFSVYTPS